MTRLSALTIFMSFMSFTACGIASTGSDDSAADDEGGAPADSTGIARQTCVAHGTGGRLRDRMFETFIARDGTVTEYHLYGHGPWTATPGLLVYLHGAGAQDFDQPEWNLDAIANAAHAHDLITLAVRTPAADLTWHTDPMHNSAVLAELISRVVLDKFPIDERRVLLVGYSSGAVLLSAFYIPLHGEDFCGGGSILFGEGHAPWVAALADHTYASAFLDHFRLHFFAGQDDPYLQDSIDGAAFYARHGFSVTQQHPAGIDHMNIPFATVIDRRLERGLLPAP